MKKTLSILGGAFLSAMIISACSKDDAGASSAAACEDFVASCTNDMFSTGINCDVYKDVDCDISEYFDCLSEACGNDDFDKLIECTQKAPTDCG